MAPSDRLRLALGYSLAALAFLCLAVCPLVHAGVTVEIHGIDEALKANVLVYLSFERYKHTTDLSADTLERLNNRVEREMQSALRPFGYYEPKVHSELTGLGHGDWRVARERTEPSGRCRL